MATALGAFLMALPYTGLTMCAVWLAIFLAKRISSLAAITAFIMAPLITFFFYNSAPVFITSLIALLVLLRHKDNIHRLLKGTEPKFMQKAEHAPSDSPPR